MARWSGNGSGSTAPGGGRLQGGNEQRPGSRVRSGIRLTSRLPQWPPQGEHHFLHCPMSEDPFLTAQWEEPGMEWVLSTRDLSLPSFHRLVSHGSAQSRQGPQVGRSNGASGCLSQQRPRDSRGQWQRACGFRSHCEQEPGEGGPGAAQAIGWSEGARMRGSLGLRGPCEGERWTVPQPEGGRSHRKGSREVAGARKPHTPGPLGPTRQRGLRQSWVMAGHAGVSRSPRVSEEK